VVIRRIRPEDSALARAIRLRALSTDRLSFGSTYEREVTRPDSFWQESARRHAESEGCAIFLAFLGDDAVGLVRGGKDETRPGVFFVHAMWVAPEARRAGVARALLGRVEEWIAAQGGTLCELQVTDAAPAARRLYEDCGYVADGHQERSPHADTMEHRMQKPLPK
jgi:GNAT superfamily N-acetyltransferase